MNPQDEPSEPAPRLRHILLGQAEIISLIPEEVQRMLDNEGFYIGSDPSDPEKGEAPLVSIKGKIFALEVGKELDPAEVIEGTRFDGPFRSSIEEDEQQAFTPYQGEPCPRRCNLCSDHQPPYEHEHHWMLEYGDEEKGTFREEGFLVCRHCPATRDIPIRDDQFLESFGL